MTDFRRILKTLADANVDFIVVGGVAADCLGTIEEHTTYDDILDHIDWMQIDEVRIRVISLPRLIRVKEKLTRPKDQLALLQLRATLEEREAKKG